MYFLLVPFTFHILFIEKRAICVFGFQVAICVVNLWMCFGGCSFCTLSILWFVKAAEAKRPREASGQVNVDVQVCGWEMMSSLLMYFGQTMEAMEAERLMRLMIIFGHEWINVRVNRWTLKLFSFPPQCTAKSHQTSHQPPAACFKTSGCLPSQDACLQSCQATSREHELEEMGEKDTAGLWVKTTVGNVRFIVFSAKTLYLLQNLLHSFMELRCLFMVQ